MKINLLLKKRFWIIIVLAVILTACQPQSPAPAPTDPVPATPPTAEATVELPETGEQSNSPGVVIEVSTHPNFGEILVDSEGMTLYMFTVDQPNQSNCDEGCLQAWPPLLAEGEVEAGDGVDPTLIGTGTMLDGRSIVTYNEMPLYYWVGDTQPGDINGQGVNDVWFVVSPQGEMIDQEISSSSPVDNDDVVMVNVANHSQYGKILVDGDGMTLYMFTKDGPNQSNCADGCLAAWPPLIASSSLVQAGEGVDDTLLGTADLADGRKIVTYNKLPLYYWAGDTKPGDSSGQNVNEVWFVVSPLGRPVGVSSGSEMDDDDGYDY
jgi:predicted lipoprotein with Yx(FWY)xxD motif